MTQCVVCQRRPPTRPAVCESCRTRLADSLTEVAQLYAALPTVLEPGRRGVQRVSGTREAPLPLRVDVLDLSMPLRGSQAVSDPHGDQTGMVSVAQVLDAWARDWTDTRSKGERLPLPTVAVLARWLSDRLDWACDEHPAVDEFAAELAETLAALRGVHGLTRLRHRLPAPCPDCDMRVLYRDDGADYIECGSCHRLWTEEEYGWLVRIVVGEVA